jgi:hypothetical protein
MMAAEFRFQRRREAQPRETALEHAGSLWIVACGTRRRTHCVNPRERTIGMLRDAQRTTHRSKVPDGEK